LAYSQSLLLGLPATADCLEQTDLVTQLCQSGRYQRLLGAEQGSLGIQSGQVAIDALSIAMFGQLKVALVGLHLFLLGFPLLLIVHLDVAEVSEKQAVATYEKSIQTAFKEVADTLGTQEYYQQQWEAQQELVKANQRYFELAEHRYAQGVDSYLTRLDAQRSLFSAQQALVSTRLAQLSNQISLFKAVGGGWQAE
jgi:hypothetical protein